MIFGIYDAIYALIIGALTGYLTDKIKNRRIRKISVILSVIAPVAIFFIFSWLEYLSIESETPYLMLVSLISLATFIPVYLLWFIALVLGRILAGINK